MKIGLLGHGVVGSGVQQIIDAGATWEVRELEVKRILVKDESEIDDPARMTTDVNEILNDPEIEVVAECMGGVEPAHTYAKRALENKKHFVTSNKKMLATCVEDLFESARRNGVTVHYEAACGGGIPWMASLDRTRRVDDIDSFRGIFNGTTNYILNQMSEKGSDFDEMLKEAQKLGYAERDPSDDIDGYDVRYKVNLSCVKAFDALVHVDDILTYGIRTINAGDIAWTEKHGMVCKLLGHGENLRDRVSAWVMPAFLRKDDVFANIPLNFNAIASDSKTLGDAVFIGQGAGSLPTAHAVVQNIIDIWKNQDPEINDKTHMEVDPSAHKGIFYIRTKNADVFQNVKNEEVNADTLLTKKISLKELADLIHQAEDASLFVAEVYA